MNECISESILGFSNAVSCVVASNSIAFNQVIISPELVSRND